MDTASRQQPPSSSAREDRVAAALRENLRKRKQQAQLQAGAQIGATKNDESKDTK